jgi:hypothetical protein
MPSLESASSDQQRLFRIGGIAALLLGIAYIVIVVLYARVGAPPTGSESWFKYLPGKTTIWWIIVGLSVLTDFLFVPVTFALYLALKDINRNAMLLASTFVGLFVVLDLAVTWTHYASLLILFRRYSQAADEIQRMGYVAAVNYASAILTSRVEVVYAIVTLSTGILIMGSVMLRGVLSKTTAFLGLSTGVLGIASLSGYSVAIIMNALFATIWILLVGYKLWRLGSKDLDSTVPQGSPP